MEELNIYIPSRGRSDILTTFGKIPKLWLDKTKIVVPPDEVEKYSNKYGAEFVLCADVNGICRTRQWIMENSKSEYLLMLDDDLQFYTRREDPNAKTPRLRNSTNEDMLNMFNLLLSWFREGIVHIGISTRHRNFQVSKDYIEISKMVSFTGYNVKKFLETGIRYDIIEIMSDYHVTLSLLELGYPNRISYIYSYGHKGSNSTGGCSLYRTPELHRISIDKLISEHSDYLVHKCKFVTKGSWYNKDEDIDEDRNLVIDGVRYDVEIAWKEAFGCKIEQGTKREELGSNWNV